MEITITHCRYTPKWDSLEEVIREATNEPKGQIVAIRREGNGCDYRQPGIYHLIFRQGDGQTSLPIKLTCVAVGHRQEG